MSFLEHKVTPPEEGIYVQVADQAKHGMNAFKLFTGDKRPSGEHSTPQVLFLDPNASRIFKR